MNCMSKKSCQIFIVYSTYKNSQDFLAIKYIISIYNFPLRGELQNIFFVFKSIEDTAYSERKKYKKELLHGNDSSSFLAEIIKFANI